MSHSLTLLSRAIMANSLLSVYRKPNHAGMYVFITIHITDTKHKAITAATLLHSPPLQIRRGYFKKQVIATISASTPKNNRNVLFFISLFFVFDESLMCCVFCCCCFCFVFFSISLSHRRVHANLRLLLTLIIKALGNC